MATNVAGTGAEMINGAIVVGLNDAGVRVTLVQVQPGVLGTYVVEFEVPADAVVGRATVVVAVKVAGGDAVYSQVSGLMIQ